MHPNVNRNQSYQFYNDCYAKVIYPLFMKRASLNKKRIDYLGINLIDNLKFFSCNFDIILE